MTISNLWPVNRSPFARLQQFFGGCQTFKFLHLDAGSGVGDQYFTTGRTAIFYVSSSSDFFDNVCWLVNRALECSAPVAMFWPFSMCAGVRSCWKIMSSSPYKCHTDSLWMKEGDSPTLPYTPCGVYVTVNLRKTILPMVLLIHNPVPLRKLGTSRTSSNKPDCSGPSLVLQTKAPLSLNSMQNLDWSLKITFDHCSDIQSLSSLWHVCSLKPL